MPEHPPTQQEGVQRFHPMQGTFPTSYGQFVRYSDYQPLRARVEKAEQRLREALAALDEIASRPTVERNPDGEDQAAETMALLAREHAKRIRLLSNQEGDRE